MVLPWALLGIAGLAFEARAALQYPHPHAVTRLAGASSRGSDDGTGPAARFLGPRGVAVDRGGNVFVADTYNRTIRRIDPAGRVSTFAGAAGEYGAQDGVGSEARFASPEALAIDAAGTLFVADSQNHAIRRIDSTGRVTTLAKVTRPWALAVTPAGEVIVTDLGGGAFLVKADGSVGSLPGIEAFTGPGLRFDGVAVTGSGTIYLLQGTAYRMVVLSPLGVATLHPGSGDYALDGAAGLAIDPAGGLYFPSVVGGVGKLTDTGVVWVAGIGKDSGFRDGPGSQARFDGLAALAFDANGVLYAADEDNNAIRRIDATGEVRTLAGLAPAQARGTVDGVGETARFTGLSGIAVGSGGNLYVTDAPAHVIRQIAPDGRVTTFAGQSGVSGATDGAGSAARFIHPEAITADKAGNLYVADSYGTTIRRITPTGAVTTVAGRSYEPNSTDGPVAKARFVYVIALAVDGAGNIYAHDGGINAVRKVSVDGIVSTLSLRSTPPENIVMPYFTGLTFDRVGNLVAAEPLVNRLCEVSTAGAVRTLAGIARSKLQNQADGAALSASIDAPSAVAADAMGNIYVVQQTGGVVRRLSPEGIVTTLAGRWAAFGYRRGSEADGHCGDTRGIAVGAEGVLYILNETAVLRVVPPEAEPKQAAATRIWRWFGSIRP